MHALNPKQEAIEAINRLPDDVALDEIVYRLYVLNKVHHGMQDIEAGRLMNSEELAREIELLQPEQITTRLPTAV